MVKQSLMQRLLQPAHVEGRGSAAFTIAGALANTVAAIMGSAPFAACLKNWRRLCSSSLFFLFFILMINYFLPMGPRIRRFFCELLYSSRA